MAWWRHPSEIWISKVHTGGLINVRAGTRNRKLTLHGLKEAFGAGSNKWGVWFHFAFAALKKLTTLSYAELEHAQSHQHMPVEWVWSINHRHADRKCTICSASKLFWAIRSAYKPVYTDIYRLVVLQRAQTPRTRDLAISCRQRQQRPGKPIALPLAHARGVRATLRMRAG